MSTKLLKAFQVTGEEHAEAFERFANAFLVDYDPAMKALGRKKDRGMDAYVYDDKTGKVITVVQSCVSPASKARTKVLATIKKLKDNNVLPEVFIYCTSANIGIELDETKKELRRDYRVTLDVCDAAWFVARHQTSQNRAAISDAYAREALEPFLRSIQPDKLYNLVLDEDQHRVAVQYLEAVNLDRSKDSNLTKGIFAALVACVTRDSAPPDKVYSKDDIVNAIAGMFPPGHTPRIKEIVPGRIQHLVNQGALHMNKAAGGYALSFKFKEKVQSNISKAQERELDFLAALSAAVKKTADEREVDYTFSAEEVVEIGHQVVLWYLREQGKVVSNPAEKLLNILNAERLLDEFLKRHPLPKETSKTSLTEDRLRDLLPSALFITLNTKNEEIAKYLRAKADLFIVHGFLQITPDVQQACQRLLGGDLLYLDTTILIRCIAEHYSVGSRKPLLNTLEGAKQVGYQLRTWSPYIEELVYHLRNRVQHEWLNHYRHRGADELAVLLRTARTLIRVFCERTKADGGELPDIVNEIIGIRNEHENAVEFLKEVFAIVTVELPHLDKNDEDLRRRTYEEWSKLKRRPDSMQEDRFQILVDHDVNSYVSILKLRRELKPEGPDYGHKVWYLSLDRMPWRIAPILSPKRESIYEVAMSLSYLMNSVATLANCGNAKIPEELIPATTILEESEMIPSEIRVIYEKEIKLDEKPFLRVRKLRELIHQLKSSAPLSVEPLDAEVDQELISEEDV